MVNFGDARVPVANRLGEEGDGFKIAMIGTGRRPALTSAPVPWATRARAMAKRFATAMAKRLATDMGFSVCNEAL